MDYARLFRTLKDIPPQQLMARFVYETKLRTLTKLPESTRRKVLLSGMAATPALRQNYLSALHVSDSKPNAKLDAVTFFFLNEERTLDVPIPWRSGDFSRLWQFNLQHFDHWRIQLDELYNGERDAQAFVNECHTLMEDWIDANPVYTFEGWHAFSVSLRIVAWTYAIATFPALATEKVKDSLWEQLVFLERNLELFASGNHLMENLRAVIVGALLFEGEAAEKLTKKILNQLERELKHQVLADGGHSERSTSYHLRMMNLLAETIACLKSAGWNVPAFYSDALFKMTQFALSMRLSNGLYSLFNDASYDASATIDESVSWALQLLDKPVPEHLNADTLALWSRLLKSANVQALSRIDSTEKALDSTQKTGYYFIKTKPFELSFDAALACPYGIPGHAHADCLHFELYYKGQAIFSDTGSSEYKGGHVRTYERSTLAHNTIELAGQDQSEMWGNFRVGRKAEPYNLLNSEALPWVSAAHDGYKHLGGSHHRLVMTYKNTAVVLDVLESAETLPFVSQFHLHPELVARQADASFEISGASELNLKLEFLGLDDSDKLTYLDEEQANAWYVPVMGKRIPRGSLRLSGNVKETRALCLVVSDEELNASLHWQKNQGELELNDEVFQLRLGTKGLELTL